MIHPSAEKILNEIKNIPSVSLFHDYSGGGGNKMDDITNMKLFTDGKGGGGGGDIPEGYSYIKIGEEFSLRRVTLVKTSIRVRLENGEFVDTYVIKPQND